MTTVLQIEGLTAKDLFQKFAELEQKIEANKKPQHEANNQDEQLLTRAQVSKRLLVTRQTLSNWHKKGVLTASRIGTRVRYKLSDIERLIETQNA
tara:strand:+ start:669 stop:953 length:285 start_codon:yes stop_codon:yes gene_type:complete